LLDNAEAASDLLARLDLAGTVSVIRTIPARIGPREVRITLRRLTTDKAKPAYAMALIDDVTDRRALERGAAATPVVRAPAPDPVSKAPPKPAPKDEVQAAPAAEKAPPQPPPKQRTLAVLPPLIKQAVDGHPDALLIAREGEVVYANPHAAAFLGFETAEELINDAGLQERFGQLGQSIAATDIAGAGGRTILATVSMSIVPWLNGPARQFMLKPVNRPVEVMIPPPKVFADLVKKEEPAKVEVAPVEPPPPPSNVVQLPQASVQQQPPEKHSANLQPADDSELRAILDTAADGIVTLDREGRILTLSAGAEAIFGFRLAEVADKPFTDLLSPESRKTARDYIAALDGPGLASIFNDGREVTAVVKQGGTVPLFLTISKLQSLRSGAYCAVVRDITQWKKTEAELRRAKEDAETASRQKSEFLARISHELRTPLNAIMGFSEVMRLERFGKLPNDKYKGYVNDIHTSGGHLLSLINDLLDLSKVEAGQLELNFTSVSLSDISDHAMRMLQESAMAARVVIRKAMPADLPNVVADLRSMRQVLMNLLSNAIKFTDPGGQVIISASTNAAGELTLRVKDTGIGMNSDQLRDAMEPFKRIETEGRDAPGTGLGLPLTKALAEANRARFEMSSEPRKGTLAEITFPTTRVLAE
jgi:PAS domain S-box-containing protein